jgi:hypothetical protein
MSLGLSSDNVEDFLAKGSITVLPNTLVNGVGTILDVSVIQVSLPTNVNATLVGTSTSDRDTDVGFSGRLASDLIDDVISIYSPLALRRRFHTFRIHHQGKISTLFSN